MKKKARRFEDLGKENLKKNANFSLVAKSMTPRAALEVECLQDRNTTNKNVGRHKSDHRTLSIYDDVGSIKIPNTSQGINGPQTVQSTVSSCTRHSQYLRSRSSKTGKRAPVEPSLPPVTEKDSNGTKQSTVGPLA